MFRGEVESANSMIATVQVSSQLLQLNAHYLCLSEDPPNDRSFAVLVSRLGARAQVHLGAFLGGRKRPHQSAPITICAYKVSLFPYPHKRSPAPFPTQVSISAPSPPSACQAPRRRFNHQSTGSSPCRRCHPYRDLRCEDRCSLLEGEGRLAIRPRAERKGLPSAGKSGTH